MQKVMREVRYSGAGVGGPPVWVEFGQEGWQHRRDKVELLPGLHKEELYLVVPLGDPGESPHERLRYVPPTRRSPKEQKSEREERCLGTGGVSLLKSEVFMTRFFLYEPGHKCHLFVCVYIYIYISYICIDRILINIYIHICQRRRPLLWKSIVQFLLSCGIRMVPADPLWALFWYPWDYSCHHFGG